MSNISVGVTSTSATQTSSTATSQTSKNKLDEDDFMLLLLAQLKTQDPLEPMSNQEMMSQMTQLNSLTALKGMQEAITKSAYYQQLSYGSSLINKEVGWNGEEGVERGVVSGVIVENNNVFVKIGDKQIAISDILDVTAAQ